MESARPTCFLIADISGYTGYLSTVEIDHASDILTDLLEVIVTALQPGFELSRIEGDAAFMFAMGDNLDGSMLLDTIERCYFGFRRRRRDVRQATSCDCNACSRIPDLDLKFIAHHGPTIVQEVAGRRELLGIDAIVVHRLSKNGVVEHLGMGAYSLFSQQCVDAAGLDPELLGMTQRTEMYDDVGDIATWVHDLERRWQEEEKQKRVRVEPEESVLTIEVPTNVPPQLAWEFLTTPGQRMSWQPWVTEVAVKGALSGKRGVGSANHCMHGKDVAIEEILDWRPFDYVTDRTIVETPGGPVKLIHTIEFEPTPDGTLIHIRYSVDQEADQDPELLEAAGAAYEALIRPAIPDLVAQLEGVFAERTSRPSIA